MHTDRELNHRNYLVGNAWIRLSFLIVIMVLISIVLGYRKADGNIPIGKINHPGYSKTIRLPFPVLCSKIAIEEALDKQNFASHFNDDSLSLQEVTQLLWSANMRNVQGIGHTIPSLNELCPLDIYLIGSKIKGLSAGVFHFMPAENALLQVTSGDKLSRLYAGAGLPANIDKGAAVLIITGWYNKATIKYGERGKRFVHMEAGYAAQNIFLQSASLDVGLVNISAFNDSAVDAILNLSDNEVPLYIIPIGRKWK